MHILVLGNYRRQEIERLLAVFRKDLPGWPNIHVLGFMTLESSVLHFQSGTNFMGVIGA
jgi:hypothetical protein